MRAAVRGTGRARRSRASSARRPDRTGGADPVEIADALERLLDDRGLWERRSEQGLAFAKSCTWDNAVADVQDGLRRALRAQEIGLRGQPDEAVRPPLDGPIPQSWAESARTVPYERASSQEATDRLFARLSADDVAEVATLLDADLREEWERAGDADRRTLALIFGAALEVPAILEKTGLSAVLPPEDVHAMARGPRAGGGSLYYADMLADSLRRVGTSMDDVRRGLDFGCSSGRVVRALAAAYPEAEWHGVDPNEGAIGWAREHLPGIAFEVSPQDPPLPFADGAFDFVTAISIWSHYGEPAALRWLAEMHRIIRPGGHLVFSTHGLHSVSYYAQTAERSPAQLAQIRRELYRSGYWFAPEFGEEGDWGVEHPEWGTAFFTPEWLARFALPAWSIEDFAVGQNADNQDSMRLSSGGLCDVLLSFAGFVLFMSNGFLSALVCFGSILNSSLSAFSIFSVVGRAIFDLQASALFRARR